MFVLRKTTQEKKKTHPVRDVPWDFSSKLVDLHDFALFFSASSQLVYCGLFIFSECFHTSAVFFITFTTYFLLVLHNCFYYVVLQLHYLCRISLSALPQGTVLHYSDVSICSRLLVFVSF